MTKDKESILGLFDIDENAVYTVSELAPLLKTSKRTLRYYCTEGVFGNAGKIGKKSWLIPGSDVISLLPLLTNRP